ncbi:uncharacterized protein LOC115803211 [Delphinapterus leucas]|uniref:Uncharacterized protein LOC115803211 n=1 Tax=Delphinapterus leucas TaxID=9749 RepID=A0A7F8KA87_DELLE|nr:uncharacterized protein LOC115803211 [Delphinapterus leucas]
MSGGVQGGVGPWPSSDPVFLIAAAPPAVPAADRWVFPGAALATEGSSVPGPGLTLIWPFATEFPTWPAGAPRWGQRPREEGTGCQVSQRPQSGNLRNLFSSSDGWECTVLWSGPCPSGACSSPRSPAEPSYAEQGSCTVTPRPTRWEGPWEPLLTFCPRGPTNHSWKGAHFSHSFFGLYRDHPQLFSKKYGAYLVHSRDFISAQDRPRARNVGAFTDFVQKAKLQKVQGQPRQDSHFPSSGSPTLVTGTGLRPWKQASLGASLRCCTARPGPPPLDRLSAWVFRRNSSQLCGRSPLRVGGSGALSGLDSGTHFWLENQDALALCCPCAGFTRFSEDLVLS